MAIELDDGTIVRSLPEQVSYNDERINEQREEIDNLAARIESALAGVLHYKGSVATYADLPADAEIGDVYNVIDTGANYAWTGSEWDELGMTVDLSNYVAKTGTNIMEGSYKIRSTNAAGISYESGVYQGWFGMDTSGNFSVSTTYPFNKAVKPYTNNLLDLGTSTFKWRELHIYTINLSSKLNPNSSGYGLTLPDTSGFTADSEVVDTASAQNITGVKTFRNRIKIVDANNLYTGLEVYTSQYYNTLARGNSDKIRIGGTQVEFANRLVPFTSGGADLGVSANKWGNLFLSGKINTNASNYGLTLPDTSGFTADSELLDAASNQTIDGIKTFSSHVILSTIKNSYSQYAISLFNDQIRFNGNIAPQINNAKDIGTNSLQWKDLYLAGNLTDGTNSVNIADLKALIDYAKAQGWIS